MRWLVVIVIFLAQTSNAAKAQPPEISGYELDWSDEFQGNVLDQSRWSPQFNLNPTNNSLHAYLPGNVFVSGGNLVILSENQPFESFAFRSGQVITTSSHRFGRFEVRAKLPTSTGMWPAIWLLPDAPWPSQGEIDIMENRGNQPLLTSSAFHWGTNPPFSHNFTYTEFQTGADDNPVNFHDSFHVYAAEWDPEQIRFYVDGAHHHTVRNSNVGNFLTNAQTNPMRLIINTAVGGNFLPNPDFSTQWPQRFEVDYVYVYDRVGTPVLDLENTGFESSDNSLANWSLFGNAGSNVSVNRSHSLSGNQSLKVYGQFSGETNFSGIEQGVSVLPGDVIRLQANAFVDAADTIAGTSNRAILKLDFYNEQYGAFGSNTYISSQEITLADGTSPNNTWMNREFFAIAPDGAVEARLAIVFAQNDNGTGAVFVDDVEFENMSASQDLSPSSVKVINGLEASGAVGDLEESDDQDFRFSAEPATEIASPIRLLLEATTFINDPSAMSFQIENAINTANVRVEVRALNQNTSNFDLLGSDSVDLNDGILSVQVGGDISRFIDSETGRISFEIGYRTVGPTLFFPWSVNIDQVQWSVQR